MSALPQSPLNSREALLDLAREVKDGVVPDMDTCLALMAVPEENALWLCAGADMLREARFGRTVHLCVICNGRSGRCSEDCAFCSQSAHGSAVVDEYPLMSAGDLAARGKDLADTPVNRYSVVTSGRRLSKKEVATVAAGLSGIDPEKLHTCASLGILDRESLDALKRSGVSRYHHNLETAESYFSQICTTHTYQDRIDTIQAARSAGMSICAGGILGMGESDEQIAELAVALRELAVDAVPLNFLVPVGGTAGPRLYSLTPMKCLKIIAVFRYVLPETEIIICGGREYNLKALHPLVFYAGASGIMTGDYLTTAGRSLADDLAMLEMLGMTPRRSR
ncbi:MAG: biotin synthase BioB [Thermodesulfobacteriota bacterium]|nr:biotin synthase BioB [Thermodesulfobacteriota bacterium]